jgi:hypothetical protein
MTTLTGYATTIVAVNEIISAYASGAYEPLLFTSNAPQVVFGSFTVPELIAARLSVSGCNSGPATLLITLYADGVATACHVYVTSAVEELFLTAPYAFSPKVLYQICVQYLGSAGVASVRTVSLTS